MLMGKQARVSWWTAEPSEEGLTDITVGALLDRAATRFGAAEAVVTSAYDDVGLNVRWTYQELKRRADRMARGLIALGLSPRSRIAVWAPNVPQWLVAEFAAAKAGLVLVTANPTYRGEELRYVLDDADVKALLLYPRIRHLDLLGEFTSVRHLLPRLDAVYSLGEPADGVEPVSLLDRLADRVPEAELARRQAAVSTHDIAQIQYTSGTTGRPKGAQLTHHGLVNNARLFARRWNVTHADRWCNPMPLFHTAGCAMVTLGAMWHGACHLPIVWFDPARVFATIGRERATILETVPTMIVRLLTEAPAMAGDLSSLRIVGTGGSPAPSELGVRLRDEWDTRLRIVYGLTETSPLISSVPEIDTDERAFTTVGPPLPEIDVRIVDRSGETTPTGVPGELLVRGYLVMDGYLNRPDATREVMDADGWFHTGDAATMDDDGYLRIVGRIKDVVIRGGENIYPAEIEALLTQHPAVTEAQVVGVPDAYYGEEVCAAVIADAPVDPEEVRAWLRLRVTHQKVPRYVVAVDRYPLTASGKVQKFALREQVLEHLGLKSPGEGP
jgi:fatty-acyl-CoA synthase